jgi:superfamily II DNA or RNA helicase
MYGDITYGPTIKDLVEMGYLCNVRYFGIPGITVEDFKSKDFSGTELNNDVLDEILKKRQVYGNMIAHYRDLAHNKACIVFCRSVKAAEDTAQRFRDAGYRFESIDGKMTDKERKALIGGLKSGAIHGLTSCELICFGLDVPKVECIIKLRLTLSKSLDSQMNGRGLRPYEGKEYCIILDPVGALAEHGHPLFDYEWKFHGQEKRGRKKGIDPASLKLCTECFLYFLSDICPNCGTERGKKPPKKYEEIDGRLIEITGPVKLNDRPPEEKREFQDKYSELMESITGADTDELMDKYVKELLKLAADAGLNAMSVYWRLSQGMRAVNVPVLHSIRRVKEYAPGWVWMQKKVIERKLGR